MSDWVIEAEELTKIYQMGEVEVPALRTVRDRTAGQVVEAQLHRAGERGWPWSSWA